MDRLALTLQPSEQTVLTAAATIYAAYIASGRVATGNETEWMARSVKEATWLAQAVDDAIIADDEVGK